MSRRAPVLLLAAALLLSSLTSALSTASTTVADEIDCAWPIVTDPDRTNLAYPDTDATYWTTPYRVEPDTRLILDGNYAEARFMSFNTYDTTGGAFTVNDVPSGIYDYEIEPDAGSRNPWQERVKHITDANSNFTVTIASDVDTSQSNTIPLAPIGTEDGSIGYVLLRVYLPKNADFSAVELPSVTIESSTGTRSLQPCETQQQRAPSKAIRTLLKQAASKVVGTQVMAAAAPCRGSACPPDLQFARASAATTNSVFPNSASAYVSALFRPDRKKVVLVRGRAPRTPRQPPGTEPKPWPSAKYQLRYFSLCNNVYKRPWPVIINTLPNGGQDVGCRADSQTTLDSKGRYTYVVAAQSQKRAVSRFDDVTFIPTSKKYKRFREVLIFRNMLSNPNFRRSALNAPQNRSAAGAAKAMGKYYPRTVSCALSTYLAHGPDHCFRTAVHGRG